MPTGIATNRTAITLPMELSNEIIQQTQEASAIMSLARQIALPGNGVTIPVITGDAEASWVDETAEKPVSNPSLTQKMMTPHKLAVIVPFSNEFRRDAAGLYDALVERLPLALAAKFDATVFFGTGGTALANFDTFENVTEQSVAGSGNSPVYSALVACDTDIATHGGTLNGFVLSPQGRGVLLSALDGDGRPLFVNNAAEGAIPMVLGARTLVNKQAHREGSVETIGFAGGWTQAMYGTVAGVQIDIADQATLGNGNTAINLFQRNMFAVRAEIEVGFVADTTMFNAITRPETGTGE